MKTHYNQKTFEFQAENSRKIVAHFNRGNISSDAGGVLLKQVVLELNVPSYRVEQARKIRNEDRWYREPCPHGGDLKN